jgi:hypothetical protein
MRNSYKVLTLAVASIELAYPARAYLGDDAKQYPKGTTEAGIREHFAGAKATPISFSDQPGMSGVMYLSLPGRPTFEFCDEILVAAWTANDGGDLIEFRHLVEENSRVLGGENIRMEGRTDSLGKEWTEISAHWPLPGSRIGIVEVIEYAGQGMLVEQKVEDTNRCLR